MYQEIFENLGLSPNEAKIYETLVEHGEMGVSQVTSLAQVHRRNAYDAIRRLIDKGLCFETMSAKENIYNAVDPGFFCGFPVMVMESFMRRRQAAVDLARLRDNL